MRAKLYPFNRVVGSTKFGKQRCEVCVDVSETNTLTSNVTGETYKINHKLNCDDNCLRYLLSYKCCGNQFVGGKQLRGLGIDETTIRTIIKTIPLLKAACKNIRLNVLTAWNIMIFLSIIQ